MSSAHQLQQPSFYKNVQLHTKLGCGESCPLLKPGYNVELWRVAQAAARQASRRFDSSFNLETNVGHGIIDPPRRVELIDGELHGNGYIWVAKNEPMPHYHDDHRDETTEGVYREMFEIFLETQQRQFQSSFGPNLELLLWCSVGTQDVALLSAALSLQRHLKTPACIAMSLLCSAIEANFDEAVPILLQRSKTGDPTRPLMALFRRFSVLFYRIADRHAEAHEESKRAVAIYRELVHFYGAENCYSSINVDLLKSYQVISFLSMFDYVETINLIESLPSSLFQNEQRSNEESLLMSTFFDACLQKNVRIFTDAVLPLLRCGAVGRPDLLDFNPTSVEGVRFEATNAFQTVIEHEIAARLVIEMRGLERCCTLNVTSLMSTSERLAHAHGVALQQHGALQPAQQQQQLQLPVRNDHPFVDLQCYGLFFEQFYPRSLQNHCRTVILRRMPKGMKQRREAIKRLKLPLCVSDFLQYKDLDDIIFLVD